MMEAGSIHLKDLVLVGGGHAHVHVVKMMGMNPIEGLRVTLISKDVESPYSGMIPGYIAGSYSREECHIDLGRLCRFASVIMLHTEVVNIDTRRRLVYCSDQRPPIRYDVMSINIGIVPRPLARRDQSYNSIEVKPIASRCDLSVDFSRTSALITEVEPIDELTSRCDLSINNSHCSITAVKPIDKFASRWDLLLDKLLQGSFQSTMTIAVVGGGAGGVELCFAVHYRIHQHFEQHGIDPDKIQIVLINRGQCILPTHGHQARQIVLRLLEEKSIRLFNATDVCDVSGSGLITRDGQCINANEVFWCTQAVGHEWLRRTGLQCDEDAFIEVNASLESINTKHVFACGDICRNLVHPRPKAGVFAVRAGPPLYRNLCHAIHNEPLEEWEPQDIFLGIIGTGYGYGVASKGGLGVEGRHMWKLKDRIDRKWMAGYQELPSMEEMLAKKSKTGTLNGTSSQTDVSTLALGMGQEVIDMLSQAKMRCGGCGSKVGATVLTSVLRRIRKYSQVTRPEVVSGVGHHRGDDAALVMPPVSPALLVHTLDYFRSFIGDPFIMGQIAVNHALSDIYAMNADPVTALALCIVPYGPEDKMEDSLVQILSGALVMLNSANCALVGGHTSEGTDATLGLGFSVTGVVHPDHSLPKGPLVMGHVLILTKPLGTGTILAADMRAKAKGRWVQCAIESMLQSNRLAAKVLHNHGCVACTDVTGFGLLGHLIEMIQFDDDVDTEDDPSIAELHLQDSHTDLDNPGRVAVELYLSNIPTLPGAKDTIEAGIVSSLHPQNIRCARVISNCGLGAGHAVYPLLFDPQVRTYGGALLVIFRKLLITSLHSVIITPHPLNRHREDC
jgi:selenide,water dikinase